MHTMKSHAANLKPKSGGRAAGSQQAAFELKHRVVMSLNKLADRDTNQLGVEELEKIIDGLGPEGIAPFLSCIIDMESEQKSSVRKECVRIMGLLVRVYGAFLSPYLGKIVTSIVKRLKDADSVVRDACVETMSILASSFTTYVSGGEGGPFITIAKPLFEALGEQNRYVQAGAALCLSKVIDSANEPPAPVLQPMLTRVIKLLKNPHFMAKPALIELIKSIIQVGGAPTNNVLSAAVTSIIESLKNSDWNTRKAACVALSGIAINAGPSVSSFKSNCIRSLECCRFDKVKPVRDAVMNALQCWKNLLETESINTSEAGSSTKENFNSVDYPDVTRDSDADWRETNSRKTGSVIASSGNSNSSKSKRTPLKQGMFSQVDNHQHSKPNDWCVEISLPKARAVTLVDNHNEESEGSCITRTFETTTGNATPLHYNKYVDDDKLDCSSVSELVSGRFQTKHVNTTNATLDERNSVKCGKIYLESSNDEVDSENRYLLTTKECASVDSKVDAFQPQALHGCCQQTANELAFIRKQLLEIESKQSNLLDLLQAFMGNSMGSLSTMQLKIHNLENAVDLITQNLIQKGNKSIIDNAKFKKDESFTSSHFPSTCTPRPSVDANFAKLSLLSKTTTESWDETLSSKSNCSGKDSAELWMDSKLSPTTNTSLKEIKGSIGRESLNSGNNYGCGETLAPPRNSTVKTNPSESRHSFWQRTKDFIRTGNIDAAYVEALCADDDLALIELMDRTGAVLERLSDETANEVLCTLATHILDQRFLCSILPWLQQVVDLSVTRGARHLHLSTNVRRELLLAIHEAASMNFSRPVERASLVQLAAKLRRLWCEENSRGAISSKKHELSTQSKRLIGC